MRTEAPTAVGTRAIPSAATVIAGSDNGDVTLLVSTRDVLDRSGVAWLILRGPAEANDRCQEIDILVEPDSMAVIKAALRPLGFRETLEPGRGSHRFLVAYDAVQDRWLKLDLVDEVAVGPVHEVPIAGARQVLARRARSDGFPVLSQGDELWAMLLHRVGDRRAGGGVRRLQAEQVRRMAVNADPSSPLARSFDGVSPTGRWGDRSLSGPAAAIDLARRGQIDDLARMTRAAINSRRNAGLDAAARSARHAARHIVRRLRSTVTFPARPGGAIVVLLGPDGAGKSGLAAALCRDTPLPVRRRYLGLYGAAGPRPVFGSGGIGRLWWVVRASAAAWLDRRRGRIVVFDRYVDDIRSARGPKSRLRRAMYRTVAVRPDVLLVLDAPGETLHARRPEHTAIEAERDRRRYLAMAAHRPEATVIDATRSPANVAAAAQSVLWTWLSTRA
ncbi:MAG: dTMP kinase [Chloroflexota bacterium]